MICLGHFWALSKISFSVFLSYFSAWSTWMSCLWCVKVSRPLFVLDGQFLDNESLSSNSQFVTFWALLKNQSLCHFCAIFPTEVPACIVFSEWEWEILIFFREPLLWLIFRYFGGYAKISFLVVVRDFSTWSTWMHCVYCAKVSRSP